MKPLVILLLALMFLPFALNATHLRGGQIRVERVNTSSLTCKIEITVYTNTNSEIKFGEGTLDFGDGSTHTTPTIENTSRPDIFVGLGMVTYSIMHTYAASGVYLVSYTEANLSGGILNIFNSVEARMYIETLIIIDPVSSWDSPLFPAEPIFICQSGIPYSFSASGIDPNLTNDFFYKYSLVTQAPMLENYRLPESLEINEDTGIITWDTKFEGSFIQGEIWILVRVDKFSKEGQFLTAITRAMQIIVEDHDSEIDMTSSVIDSNSRVVVEDGNEKTVKILLSDEEYPEDIHLDIFNSEALESNVSLEQYDSIADKKYRVAKVSFNTTSGIVSDLPYVVTLRGISKYRKDITFLYMTKDVPLPARPMVTTGIEDGFATNSRIYPNPFRAELFIEGSHATFINTLGNVVMQSVLQEGQPLNTSALPGGFYVLQVVDDNGMRKTIKVTKE